MNDPRVQAVMQITGAAFVVITVLCITALSVAGTYSLIINLLGYCG